MVIRMRLVSANIKGSATKGTLASSNILWIRRRRRFLGIHQAQQSQAMKRSLRKVCAIRILHADIPSAYSVTALLQDSLPLTKRWLKCRDRWMLWKYSLLQCFNLLNSTCLLVLSLACMWILNPSQDIKSFMWEVNHLNNHIRLVFKIKLHPKQQMVDNLLPEQRSKDKSQ